jgi:predicted signal transduction protein with EAL and GGDEF domain
VLLHRGGLPAARELARTLLEVCAQPVPLDGRTASVRASIGIAEHRAGASTGRLLHEADLALYEAKRQGKGRYRRYDRDLAAAVEEQRRLEAELGGALAAGQLELVYQPVVSLVRGSTMAVEAVLRWQHPRLGVLGPEQFRTAAAATGLLSELDRWSLRAGVRQLAVWHAEDPAFLLSLRLSARYLSDGTVAADLRDALTEVGLTGDLLVVRITDTAELVELEPVLGELRGLGVQICLEDFGVGQSAVAHLRRFQVDVLKLHPMFLRDLETVGEAAALVGAVVDRARSVGIASVAGGVETSAQAARLRDLGCLAATGALFGAPVPAGGITVRTRILV